jgi:hypothetical protein
MPKSVVNKTLCMKNVDSMVNGFEIKMMVHISSPIYLKDGRIGCAD